MQMENLIFLQEDQVVENRPCSSYYQIWGT